MLCGCSGFRFTVRVIKRERLGTRLGGPDGKQCGMNYTGETERTLKARVSEHRRPSSSASEVANHLFREHRRRQFRSGNVKILDREPDWFRRGIKEAVYIRQLQPSLNRDGGNTNYRGVRNNLLRSLHLHSDFMH